MIKVLHYSPHDENDGIAKYQEQYFKGMSSIADVENVFFDVSPLKFRLMPEEEKKKVLLRLRRELKQYDIFHVQHEFGLFMYDDFLQIVQAAKAARVKLVVSVHLSPDFAIKVPTLGGLSPRNLVKFARKKKHYYAMRKQHIIPFIEADQLLVHNDITARSLVNAGADSNKIVKLPHPVYELDAPQKTDVIQHALQKRPGDVLFCTVGMLHKYKGIFDAVNALKFLPENYKLAIIGGMNPFSNEVPIYNKICNQIRALQLQDRVFITGFVESDDHMNSLIQECDISVFPYDGFYYGNLSSGSINLALANGLPVIAYPTQGFRELSAEADGAVKLCDTFAYYELARELQRLDVDRQRELSNQYAEKMSWSKMSHKLYEIYASLASKN